MELTSKEKKLIQKTRIKVVVAADGKRYYYPQVQNSWKWLGWSTFDLWDVEVMKLCRDSEIDIDTMYESVKAAKSIIDKYIEGRNEVILQRRKEKARDNPEYVHYADYPTE